MVRRFVLLATVLACSSCLWAQGAPAVEVFGGLSIGAVSDGDRAEHAFGWQASVAGNLHPNFGVVADFGGQYKSLDSEIGIPGAEVSLRAHQFLFGPRVSARSARTSVFAHALVGGANGRASSNFEGTSASASDTFLMAGFGGGVDVNAGDGIAIRVLQVDWLPVQVDDQWFKKILRIGVGIVFKAGE